MFNRREIEFLSQHSPRTDDCGSYKPAINALDLLKGFEHDLRQSSDVTELLDGKQPKDIAEAVLKLYRRGEYVKFTFRMDSATTPSATFMVTTREERVPCEWWGPHTDKLVDLHTTTMTFMAQEPCFTAPHGDWADAYNIAFAMNHIKVRIIVSPAAAKCSCCDAKFALISQH